MRLLHTSDWHVGRSLHGTDLLAEQEAVLSRLAQVVRAERVDVVLVAGDVYDRAVPSADATGVLDRVLSRLRAAGATVVLTPGNHDSARRLGFASGLLAVSGVHVRATTASLDEPVLLSDEHGEVAVYGLPFLEPEVARHELGADLARSHQAVLSAAMDKVRADLYFRPGARSVVLAHAFVGGGLPSESERDIAVGGVDLVSPSVFDGVDYVALGHLHRPQTLEPAAALQRLTAALLLRRGGADQAGLAGRPRRHRPRRGPCRAAAGAPAAVRPERHSWPSCWATPPTRRSWSTSCPPGSPTRCVPTDAMRRLQTRFPHCVHLEWSGAPSGSDDRSYTERLRGRDPLSVAGEFVGHVRGGVGPTAAERELLGRALAAADREEAAR